jgi:5-methylcytosine-specific restriction endonuclease McrA
MVRWSKGKAADCNPALCRFESGSHLYVTHAPDQAEPGSGLLSRTRGFDSLRGCWYNSPMTKSEACAKARASKTTFKNQWTDVDWSKVPFEKLTNPKRKRRRVLEEAKFTCERCGFNQTRPDGQSVIQVDHIDGNNRNWARNNLRAWCPNCHAVHSEHFMFYGRRHTGDMTRFDTRSSRRGVKDNTQVSET